MSSFCVLSSPSYYLYTYDKMVAPNVSLRREAEMSPEMLGALLKHHYARRMLSHDEPPMGQYRYVQTNRRTFFPAIHVQTVHK